jgi:hypothetical protein
MQSTDYSASEAVQLKAYFNEVRLDIAAIFPTLEP